jgi:outer membrane protein assembly factor BamA
LGNLIFTNRFDSGIIYLLKIFFISFSAIVFITEISSAQILNTAPPIPYKDQYDVKDWLKDVFGKKNKSSDTASILIPSKKLILSILPGISYNPASSVVVGVEGSASWYYGDPSNTINSSVAAGVSYSLKNQLKISLASNIFTNENKWLIASDVRFWKFVQNTYGLGTGTPDSNEENMDFDLIRFNQNVLRKVSRFFYLGLGYDLQYYSKIETINNDNDSIIYPSFNSTYSQQNGFDTASYLSSGFLATAYYDSRDNTINPYKGMVLTVQYRNYNEFLGSSSNYQLLDYQIKKYFSFNKKDTYILALWFSGSNVLNGRVPYMALNATGWDKYNATGRGYVQGRFRGRDEMYFEIENRITLTKNRFFGLAIFANAESLSYPDGGVKLLCSVCID